MNAQGLIGVRVLLKRWWLFLLLLASTVGGMFSGFRAAPSQYEATVRFLVNAPPSANVTLYQGGAGQPTQSQQIAAAEAAFIEILQSPTVLRRTVEAFPVSIPADELARRLTVVKPRDSEFVWVSVRANDPQEASYLANTLVDTAKQHYGQLMAGPSASAREFISIQVSNALQDLLSARQALIDFKAAHQINDLPAEISAERAVISNLVLEKEYAVALQQPEQVTAYEQLITQHRVELDRLTALSDEYEVLRGDVERAGSYYEFLLDKETEATLKENEILRAGFIQVAEPAVPPQDPVSPYNLKLIAAGAVASLLLGLVLAIMLEYTQTRRPAKREEATTKVWRSQP